jgi:hypothetical protein
VVSFTPLPLHPLGKSPGSHWIGSWVGPRASLDAVVKRKIHSPYRDSNPRPSSLVSCKVRNLSIQSVLSYFKASRMLQRYGARVAFGRFPIRILAGLPAILTEVIRGFPHSLQTNSGTKPPGGERPSSVSIHYRLVSFDAI